MALSIRKRSRKWKMWSTHRPKAHQQWA